MWGAHTHTQTHTEVHGLHPESSSAAPWSHYTEKKHGQHALTHIMMRSLEVFGLSANSWQLRTLNPYPSQACPLISADLMVMGSRPVFSTLKTFLRVKFGSLTFVSEIPGILFRELLRNKKGKLVIFFFLNYIYRQCITVACVTW